MVQSILRANILHCAVTSVGTKGVISINVMHVAIQKNNGLSAKKSNLKQTVLNK